MLILGRWRWLVEKWRLTEVDGCDNVHGVSGLWLGNSDGLWCGGDGGYRLPVDVSGVTTRIPEKLLGDEGPSSGGTKLSSTFITAEVTFTKPKQPTYAKDPTEIHGIKRRQNEGLQAFMDRFKSESSHIKGVPPVLRVSTFMHGHGHPELAKKLNDKTQDGGRNVREC
ncbi:hypothetical protein Tco_0044865 [Tanacetum coccineum]